MPKSGMTITRSSAPAKSDWRPIKGQSLQPLGPQHKGLPSTPSNELAADAVRIASSPGGINPKQRIY
jgi:hypothetical protein